MLTFLDHESLKLAHIHSKSCIGRVTWIWRCKNINDPNKICRFMFLFVSYVREVD